MFIYWKQYIWNNDLIINCFPLISINLRVNRQISIKKMSELVLKNASMLVWKASKAWRFLNGTINIYKPAEMATNTVIKAIKTNICRGQTTVIILWSVKKTILIVWNSCIFSDLNELELDEPKPLVQIHRDGDKGYDIQLVPNLGQDRFATGPRYTEDMLKILPAQYLGYHTSGVLG